MSTWTSITLSCENPVYKQQDKFSPKLEEKAEKIFDENYRVYHNQNHNPVLEVHGNQLERSEKLLEGILKQDEVAVVITVNNTSGDSSAVVYGGGDSITIEEKLEGISGLDGMDLAAGLSNTYPLQPDTPD